MADSIETLLSKPDVVTHFDILIDASPERVYQAAFVFLVLFAVMVIYNDLMKTIPGLADRLP